MKRICLVGLTALMVSASALAQQGGDGDNLSACLSQALGPAERTTLTRWVFASMARSPDLQDMAVISESQRQTINAATAALVQRVLTQTCREPVVEALRRNGAGAMRSALQTIAMSAGRDVIGSPPVAAQLLATLGYVDMGALFQLQQEALRQKNAAR